MCAAIPYIQGMIRTPLLDTAMEEIAQGRGVSFNQVVAEHKAAIPLGDFTHAEDVAAAVVFLVSDYARHVTGSELLVDGGIVSCNTIAAARIDLVERLHSVHA